MLSACANTAAISAARTTSPAHPSRLIDVKREYLQLLRRKAEIIAQKRGRDRYALDPLAFVLENFEWAEGEGPDDWQAEQLRSIGDQLKAGGDAGAVIRQAIASGHGIGKSALVAWLILWAICTFEDTRGAVTANTEKQLKTKTWTELSNWFRRCPAAKAAFVLTATAIFSKDETRVQNWRIDQVPWNERNTEAFAGLHNKGKRILLVFDEASAIPDIIWEVSEGSLTDADTQILWCVFGNPTRNTGRFKGCFVGKTAHRWQSRQIDSRSCKFSNKAQIQEWVDDYGEDSDFVKVRVRGMFPTQSAKQFISVADVDAAYGRQLRIDQYGFAPKIIAVDPAWEGDDELVIGLRQGLAFKILRTIRKNDNDMQVAAIVAQYEDEEKADAVFIDGGYGTGIISAGKALGRKWRLVWFSGESADPGCFNKRAEMWNAVKKWLKEGGAIPQDTVLYNDLIGPETIFRADGKIQLESKKAMKARGLASPGRADCLAITFAFPVRAKSAVDKVKEAFPRKSYDPLRHGF